jgi:hypothetical protein
MAAIVFISHATQFAQCHVDIEHALEELEQGRPYNSC